MKRVNLIGLLPFYLLAVILFVGIAAGGSKAVTVITEEFNDQSHRIVIDPGHGGIDGGATSCTGVLESRINLEIALRLEDLMHFLGFETVMIRRTDTSVHTTGGSIAQIKVSDLKERVRIVNETKNAFLISIHQNTFPSEKYSGAQVFFGANDSKAAATKLQAAFIQNLNPGSRRSCKKADGIYLMEKIGQPGLLIECGFLSNPEEEALLRSADYQRKIACVIASTVSSFLLDGQTND